MFAKTRARPTATAVNKLVILDLDDTIYPIAKEHMDNRRCS